MYIPHCRFPLIFPTAAVGAVGECCRRFVFHDGVCKLRFCAPLAVVTHCTCVSITAVDGVRGIILTDPRSPDIREGVAAYPLASAFGSRLNAAGLRLYISMWLIVRLAARPLFWLYLFLYLLCFLLDVLSSIFLMYGPVLTFLF